MISHLYPASTPSLNLNFKSSRVVDPRISCTRNSTATYVDPVSGLLKTAAANEARVDEDGLLFEEAKTNIFEYSSLQNTSYLSATGTAPTYNYAVAPDGTTTAALLPAGNNQVNKTFYLTATQTFSVWVKSAVVGVHGTSKISLSKGQGTPEASTQFTTTDTWQRISVTRNSTGSNTGLYFQIGQWANQDGPTQDILFWGLQIEENQLTSYIPTNGSQSQRLAELVQITGTNFTSWYNQSQGTMVLKCLQKNQGSTFNIHNGSNNRIASAYGAYYYSVVSNGTAVSQQGGTTKPLNQVFKFATSNKQDDHVLWLNGTEAARLTSGNMPVGTTTFNFFTNHGNADPVRGFVERMTFYPTRVSDDALTILTK